MDLNNKDPSIKFTIDKYASKDDIRHDLNTSLIDPIWDRVISYRSKFYQYISLNNIGRTPYFYSKLDNIVKDCSSIEEKINNCINSFNRLDEKEKESLIIKSNKNIIKFFAMSYGEALDEEFINKILSASLNDIQGLSEAKKETYDYFQSYRKINSINAINKENLLYLYSIFSSKDINNSNYRNFDFDTSYQNTQINKEYIGAPYSQIDNLMNSLFMYLENSEDSKIIKASISYYFLNYIRPFDKYNLEISLLIYKIICFGINNFDTAKYLSFESFLINKDEFDKSFKEGNRNNDLTYSIISCIKNSFDVVNSFIKDCDLISFSSREKEHHREFDVIQDEDAIKETSNIEKENVVDENIEPNEIKKPIIVENPPIEKVEPIAEEKKEETKIEPTKVETPKENINIVKEVNVKEEAKDISDKKDFVDNINLGLNETDASKFENYLLIKNPSLKKTQAHFYARHCTLNCYYTIQMFKKCEGVVYETARTSMDSLANFGYYRKEKIKNKFVYTPNKIEGK